GLGFDRLEVGPEPFPDPEVTRIPLEVRAAGGLEKQLVRDFMGERGRRGELASFVAIEVTAAWDFTSTDLHGRQVAAEFFGDLRLAEQGLEVAGVIRLIG